MYNKYIHIILTNRHTYVHTNTLTLSWPAGQRVNGVRIVLVASPWIATASGRLASPNSKTWRCPTRREASTHGQEFHVPGWFIISKRKKNEYMRLYWVMLGITPVVSYSKHTDLQNPMSCGSHVEWLRITDWTCKQNMAKTGRENWFDNAW